MANTAPPTSAPGSGPGPEPTAEQSVELLYSPAAREVWLCRVPWRSGCTVRQLLEQSPWWQGDEGLQQGLREGQLQVSVWGRKARAEQTVQTQDRIEITRGLRVDPKVARRERFASQGRKTAGLFAQRRPGAKPGY